MIRDLSRSRAFNATFEVSDGVVYAFNYASSGGTQVTKLCAISLADGIKQRMSPVVDSTPENRCRCRDR